MSDFPFPYFNHGTLSSDVIGASEELFVWFERVVNVQQRHRIESTCPRPVAGLFAWGDRFLYFGSGERRFDAEIAQTYGPRDPDGQSSDSLTEATSRFNDDLRRWATEVHDVVPLAFFVGPQTTQKDDRGLWSEEQLDRAVAQVVAYTRERPEILRLLERAPDPPDGAPGHPEIDAALSEEARYFSYIFGAVVRWDAHYALTPEVLDLLYATDTIWGPVSRLSLQESKLARNGDAVSVYLARDQDSAPDPEAALGRLAPYTQLAYLASPGARRAEVLGRLADPAALVQQLLAHQPAWREAAATSLVQLIADNWCQVGPAFEEPRKSQADLGAALLTLVQDRQDCPPEAFLHGVLYLEWAGRYADAMAVAEHGLARYPHRLDLARAAVAVANVGGLTAEAATFTDLVSDLERAVGTDGAPHERSVVDQSFALVQAGDVESARQVLMAYLRADGDMTTDVWNNLMFTVCQVGPPRSGWAEVVSGFLEALEEHEQWSDHEGLLGSASAAFNENGYAVEALRVLDWVREQRGELSGQLMVNYTYSALQTQDVEAYQRVVRVVEAALAADPEEVTSAALLENLADLQVALDAPERALELLARLKAHGHEDFASLRTSETLKPLWPRADFRALFDPPGSPDAE